MTTIELSGGRKIKVGMLFEHPEDEILDMADEVEAGVSDVDMGLDTSAFAHVCVFTAEGLVESSVVMTRERLTRFIYEARAVVKSMDRAARLADETWGSYRAARKGNE